MTEKLRLAVIPTRLVAVQFANGVQGGKKLPDGIEHATGTFASQVACAVT